MEPDEHWTRLPGGWIKEPHDGYDLYTPRANLPCNRTFTQARFSAMFWTSIGIIGFAFCIGMAIYLRVSR